MTVLKGIKWQIIVPTISLVFITGILVLAVSISSYGDKVYSVEYERIDKARSEIAFELSVIREHALLVISEFSEDPGFIYAITAGDSGSLERLAKNMLSREGFNYALITAKDGSILYKTHDIDIYDDNASYFSHIKNALGGEVISGLYGNDSEPLRAVTISPVSDENRNTIGTITLGQTLTVRDITISLKEITGCDVTFYDGMISVSSSLNFPSLSNIEPEQRERISQDVFLGGGSFKGSLNFLEGNVLSAIHPIQNPDNEIIGMLYIGIPERGANNEILMFALRGGVISLVLFTVTIFAMHFVTTTVSGKFDKMEDKMQRRDKLFRAVNQASIILLEIDEADDIRMPMISCMEHLGSALGVDHVHLWRGQLDDKGINQFVREYSWVSDYGKRKTKTPKYINSTRDNTQLDWMDKFLKNEYISGIISEMEESHQILLKPLEAKSIAMIPLFLEEQFWGMFSIDNIQRARKYSEDEIDILRSISLMMANIVRRHDLQNENLKVYYDALTGINNRRYFDKTMIRTISTLSRAGSELSVMMIDVDYFKKYNDTYGHAAGDECLIKVAETLAQCILRVDDFVARYGGEEFVVVMPSTDKVGAIAVANRMLDSIREMKIPHKASDVESIVTVSIGVTTGKVTQFHTQETFIQKADEMLYESKHKGRNRFTYGDLELTGG